ncbi:MAG: polyprenol monophosphomannose synthase [Myxococcales bacterium]|nr:MAG: polyprenol monophosphomannose synthase [Myxococcales bacterium]
MTELRTGAGALICIPTYNEQENLPRILPAVLDRVPEAHILVIDDNSPDGTGRLADEAAAKDGRVRVLHRPGKQGLGRAYLAGFKWALERDYRAIVEFDADFSHNPAYLPDFLDRLNDADVVVGSRRVKGGGVENWSLFRRLISWGGSVYARTVLGMPIMDMTGGFNGFRREVLERIDLDAIAMAGFGFQIEIKYRAHKAGFKLVEFPIVFPDRVLGKSKMDASIFFDAMASIWSLRFRVK